MSNPSRRVQYLTAAGGLLAVCAIASPRPPETPAEAVSAKETVALRRVHRNAVEIFVDRPGFGVRRLVLNLDDLVTGPKSLAEEAYAEPQPAGPGKSDPKADQKPSHFPVQDLLVERGGRFPTDDGKGSWQLRKVYLVGLMKRAEPVVYLADRNPKKRGEEPKAGTDIPTRDADAFEKAALAAVRDGEPLKAEKRGTGMRVLAPIFAGKRCTDCHDRGQLLGAFTYELERVAYDAAKDGPRTPRER